MIRVKNVREAAKAGRINEPTLWKLFADRIYTWSIYFNKTCKRTMSDTYSYILEIYTGYLSLSLSVPSVMIIDILKRSQCKQQGGIKYFHLNVETSARCFFNEKRGWERQKKKFTWYTSYVDIRHTSNVPYNLITCHNNERYIHWFESKEKINYLNLIATLIESSIYIIAIDILREGMHY